MAERPILFSGPMVRVLLEGRKTQSRRVLNLSRLPPEHTVTPELVDYYGNGRLGARIAAPDGTQTTLVLPIPYAPGDLLYVREAWQAWTCFDHLKPSKMEPTADILFIADRPTFRWDSKFRQGMHMPRWASRLTLKVTDVRVQQLQDISEEDAKAEGFEAIGADNAPEECEDHRSFVWAFHNLWDSLNEKRGFGWDANPWVVAVTFEVHRCNVDAFKDEVAA